MKDVAILIPALGRPDTIRKVIRSIRRTTSNGRIVFLCTEGDNLVIDKVLRDPEADCIVLPPNERGDYAKKINLGYRETKEPLLFLGATDLWFWPRWYEYAIEKLSDGISVVGTNDLGNPDVLAGEHSTHSLVTRDYIDQYGTIETPGEVLYEGYWHEYVDNEFIETAKSRDAFAMAMDSVVEHMHPWFGKADTDKSYRDARRRWKPGQDLFESRKSLWT
jgi:glycosyltransferase involved in cell wall biosynthesis